MKLTEELARDSVLDGWARELLQQLGFGIEGDVPSEHEGASEHTWWGPVSGRE